MCSSGRGAATDYGIVVGHHGHGQHREDGFDQGGRRIGERRDGLAGRPVRRALARGRVEPRNGIVILDLATPAHPKIASMFDGAADGWRAQRVRDRHAPLRGPAAPKYVIIDVTDICKPKYVSEYRHPNSRIHDVWVHDGIAYSAQGARAWSWWTSATAAGAADRSRTRVRHQRTRERRPHEMFPYLQKPRPASSTCSWVTRS